MEHATRTLSIRHLHSLTTLLRILHAWLIHAIIQSANHVLAAQCIELGDNSRRPDQVHS